MNLSKHCKLPLLGLCAGLLVLPPSPGEARDASNVAPPSTSRFVRLAAGSLSVNVHDVKLVELLDEVSRQAGFAVAPCVACEQRISLRFDRLPLEQALSIILQDQNFILKWKHAAAASVRPHKLWILPQPNAMQPARLAPSKQTNGDEPASVDSQASRLRSALSTGTPEDREQAAVAMGQRRDASAVGPLARALADSDPEVRRAAIDSLAEIGGADAAGALGPALRDADPRIREAAVNALGDLGGPKAIALLREAQHDAAAFVRQAATETLAELQDTGPKVCPRAAAPGSLKQSPILSKGRSPYPAIEVPSC